MPRRSKALAVVAAEPVYDCQRCGACCIADFDEPTYVTLMPSDEKRLPAKYREQMVQKIFGGSLNTKHDKQGNCVCVALKGVVGKSVSCMIYEHRPKVCRDFTPGNVNCTAARLVAGID